jgi:GNAT superfamily N-acetyltransferase
MNACAKPPQSSSLVRPATHEDVDACLPMARRFYDESGMADMIGFDSDSALMTLRHLIDDENAALFVACKGDERIGMAGALAYPMYFNIRQKAAQEMFWWVSPEHRGGTAGVRLMQSMERWAASLGCQTMTMVCLPIDGPAESIYQRMGYRPLERNFVRRL